MTKVVTFYSYKGGVGRTLSLVNAAHSLARRGLRVLMIDLDLEAPGMTHFFADRVREHGGGNRKDALDLLLAIKRICSSIRSEDEHDVGPVSLTDYVVRIGAPKSSKSSKVTYLSGSLDLLPATLDPSLSPKKGRGYLERLLDLDLPGIFGPEGPGHRFGHEARRLLERVRFEAPGDLNLTLRDRVQASYDIILVDSRTGLNESAGLCIGPLCDAIIVCTGLNEQNVEGTRYFMETSGLFGTDGKPYGVVVGPAPPWGGKATSMRLDRIRQALNIERIVTVVPYHPDAALGEPVFVVNEPSEPMALAYEALAGHIEGQLTGIRQLRPPRAPSRKSENWESYYRAYARMLPTQRLQRDPWRAETYPPPFPTAVTLEVSPAKPDAASSTAISTAVAAYHLRDDTPFERIWATANERDDSALGHLMFMRLRVLDRVPLKGKQSTRFRSLLMEPPHSEAGEMARAYALALNLDAHGAGSERFHPKMVPHFLRDLLRTFGRDTPNQLELFFHEAESSYVLFQAKLPPKLRAEICEALKHSSHWLTSWELEGEKLSRYRFVSRWDRAPPGAWPIPSMISLVSLAKGAAAASELLAWVRLCRRIHGYAWRVLVDWRHLDVIHDDPAFVAFLAEEDRQVAAIEAAIDAGEYPL